MLLGKKHKIDDPSKNAQSSNKLPEMKTEPKTLGASGFAKIKKSLKDKE